MVKGFWPTASSSRSSFSSEILVPQAASRQPPGGTVGALSLQASLSYLGRPPRATPPHVLRAPLRAWHTPHAFAQSMVGTDSIHALSRRPARIVCHRRCHGGAGLFPCRSHIISDTLLWYLVAVLVGSIRILWDEPLLLPRRDGPPPQSVPLVPADSSFVLRIFWAKSQTSRSMVGQYARSTFTAQSATALCTHWWCSVRAHPPASTALPRPATPRATRAFQGC